MRRNLSQMTGNTNSIPSSFSGKHANYISSIFACPKLFVGFSAKAFSDSETAMNIITSIADANNPFFSGRIRRKPFFRNGDSGAIGLAIVDSLSKENSEKRSSNQSTRMVLLGSRLKIKIPNLQSNSTYNPTGSVESPRTPIEFGIKNKNSKLALQSPAGLMPKLFTGSISPREMELSEDYTCVISYGPNPKKTHIFDNYVVESCGHGFTASRKEAGLSNDDRRSWRSSEGFLSFCHGCRKSLGQGKDIFMYRGERAFCSDECRQIEMMSDDSDECIENCFQNLPDLLK